MKTIPEIRQEMEAERRNGHPPSPPLERVPASQLRKLMAHERWLWKGLVPAEAVTILSALPKAGKTTLLAHLLRALEGGGDFCGQQVHAGKALVITEESETTWAERRDRLGLADHCEFVVRPFRFKPTLAEWRDFLRQLTASLRAAPAHLVVIDTLAKLWPVQQENDASEVTAALMPLLEIAYDLRTTLLLVHHLRKSGGEETTATRGSNGITASVDCILELRRYKPSDRKDRRRVLCCDARSDDRLDEVVLRLADDGRSYEACGDRYDAAQSELQTEIPGLLPAEAPGWTVEQIREAWAADADNAPPSRTLRDALRQGAEAGFWSRVGGGVRGDPYRYFLPLSNSIPVLP